MNVIIIGLSPRIIAVPLLSSNHHHSHRHNGCMWELASYIFSISINLISSRSHLWRLRWGCARQSTTKRLSSFSIINTSVGRLRVDIVRSVDWTTRIDSKHSGIHAFIPSLSAIHPVSQPGLSVCRSGRADCWVDPRRPRLSQFGELFGLGCGHN